MISAASPVLALDICGLTKTFGATRALDDVDLQIRPSEVHALLGENGSGKSTLIKILSGYHSPDRGGTVLIGGAALEFGSAAQSYLRGARFVHQDLGLVEAASISDNLSYGGGFPTRMGSINTAAVRRRTVTALETVELAVGPETLISALSPAQKTGVAVARALLADENGSECKLLVLDEPTARLPDHEVANLLEIVRTVARRGVGVLYVTHRLDEVFDIAQTATILRDGRKVASRAIEGLTRDDLLHHLLGAALETTNRTRDLDLQAGVPGLALSIVGIGSEVLDDVTLEVQFGEIVGVAGITGSGRDTLCSTLFGARKRDSGEIRVADQPLPPGRPDLAMGLGAAFVPAERKLQGAFMGLSAQENISISSLRTFWRWPSLRATKESAAAQRWFERFGIAPRTGASLQMSSFSGGNQQKVVFSKWFQRTPVLFLLDEPTQGVDVGAKAALHRTLIDAARGGAGVLMSSSDIDELVATCDRIVVLRAGRIAAVLRGAQINPHTVSRAALGIEDVLTSGANQ